MTEQKRREGLEQSHQAETLEFAYNHVDRNIVHVPKVYRYIESHRSAHATGYIFMEYVHDWNLQDVDLKQHPDIPSRDRCASRPDLGPLDPGPVGGGEPLGYIFGDHGSKTVFTSIENMNVYMDRRLEYRKDSSTIDLTPHPLVLCHGDICRRNMILEPDGSPCLVNWGLAGLYLRFFELEISCALPVRCCFCETVEA